MSRATLIWRLVFAWTVACAYGSLMVLVLAPWLQTGLVAAAFSVLGWAAFPELFLKWGGCLE